MKYTNRSEISVLCLAIPNLNVIPQPLESWLATILIEDWYKDNKSAIDKE